MIKLSHVYKVYDADSCRTEALSDVNLEIAQGEFVAVMGPSGSGKSTLLHILGAMDVATSGEYFYNDKPVHSMKPAELHRFRASEIGFVFQDFALMKYYTVAENVMLPLQFRGASAKESRIKAESLLDALGIKEVKDKMPTHISGGQKARTAIARAIITDAPIILADEPTGTLDSRTGEDIMVLFEELNRKGKTILLVTHDMQIASHANRVIYMRDGRIQ
ncbi:MAG: ABC transporter ATP-binding protein [Lachnospiraceae bacterium]|nr:ABC transporter ATP-binding protein [Lachnospiraceae bacterium]